MTAAELSRPALAPGVRLQWEPARQIHMLLYPEGAVALNPTAVAVLELCDGSRTVDGIAEELGRTYKGVEVADVRGLVSQIAERGLIVDADA